MKKMMLACLTVMPFCQAADPHEGFYQALQNIPNWQEAPEINLSEKGIKSVPGDFSSKVAKTLEKLDFSENALANFLEVADLPKLQNLYLQDNQLVGISFEKIKAPKLTLLSIQDNMLSWINIPSTFAQLEELYLQNNWLNGLPENFNLSSLKTLNLADNHLNDQFINRMTQRFQKKSGKKYLPNLRYLDLSGNNISLDAIKRLQAAANKVYIKFNNIYSEQDKGSDGYVIKF